MADGLLKRLLSLPTEALSLEAPSVAFTGCEPEASDEESGSWTLACAIGELDTDSEIGESESTTCMRRGTGSELEACDAGKLDSID